MSEPTTLKRSIAYLWILRVLIKRYAVRGFINDDGYSDSDLALALGLSDQQDIPLFLKRNRNRNKQADDFDTHAALSLIRDIHHAAEAKQSRFQLPAALKKNLESLTGLIQLSEVESDILGFSIIVDTCQPLQDALRLLPDTAFNGCILTISKILNISEHKVRKALSNDSLLVHTGLLSIEREGPDDLTRKMNLLSSEFAERMTSSADKPIHLLRDTVQRCSKPELALTDYTHLGTQFKTLCDYLSPSSKRLTTGVNILIYGQPGTGKTELTRVLAKKLSYELYEVSTSDKNEEAITGWTRLKALRASQAFLSKQKALIVFDEVEDVFNDGGLFNNSTAQSRKGWLNRCMENNPVVTFWITNSIDCIDPAFIRRFDVCLEVPVPPLKSRKKLITKHCSKFLSKDGIQCLAEYEDVAPALITRATKVISSISSDRSDSSNQLITLIDGTPCVRIVVTP